MGTMSWNVFSGRIFDGDEILADIFKIYIKKRRLIVLF